jgi:hypothetical protein
LLPLWGNNAAADVPASTKPTVDPSTRFFQFLRERQAPKVASFSIDQVIETLMAGAAGG